IIYDYAIAFHQKRLPAEHLLKSLLPLYIGKTVSFVLQVGPMEAHEAETEIDKLCLEFEHGKDFLCTCWK
ncbi:MAG: glycosyl transferase family 2, partial [Gallionellales bacterium CG08_land_8_20_14_0_20_59_87]